MASFPIAPNPNENFCIPVKCLSIFFTSKFIQFKTLSLLLLLLYQQRIPTMNSIMMMIYGKMLHFIIKLCLYKLKIIYFKRYVGCKYYGKNFKKSILMLI